jgi:hypothetical protein
VEEKMGHGGNVDPVATFVGELASPAALAKAQIMGLKSKSVIAWACFFAGMSWRRSP